MILFTVFDCMKQTCENGSFTYRQKGVSKPGDTEIFSLNESIAKETTLTRTESFLTSLLMIVLAEWSDCAFSAWIGYTTDAPPQYQFIAFTRLASLRWLYVRMGLLCDSRLRATVIGPVSKYNHKQGCQERFCKIPARISMSVFPGLEAPFYWYVETLLLRVCSM